MFYSLLKKTVSIAVSTYYRRIQIKGLENIPLDRPVLIASNHPNAFMDAVLLTLFFPRRTYSLARSDVFNTAFKRKIMNYFQIMPIYRIQDGADQLYKNTEVFEKCHSLLNQKASILIFPEGICVQERRLRRLRKGLARIAFGSLEVADFNMDLCIVPVGINYTKPSKYGGDLLLNISAPIEVEDYIEQYKKDKVRAINKLTADLETAMSKLIVIIEDFKDDELVNDLELLMEDKLLFVTSKKLNLVENNFIISRKITEGLSNFKKKDSIAFEEFKLKVKSFFSTIKNEAFKQELLNESIVKKSKLKLLSSKLFLLFLTFPVFLVGFLLNYIPFRLPYLLTEKIVKRNIEFFSSINLTLGTVFFIVYYLIISVLTAVFFHIGLVPVILIAGPFIGKFALYYRDLLEEAVAVFKMKNKPELAVKLLTDKKWIIEKTERIIKSGSEVQIKMDNQDQNFADKTKLKDSTNSN